MATVTEGKKAPSFTLQDASGRRVALEDFRGRAVVVYFYPKDDSPGCTKEACGFRDLWQDLQRAGVVVLGVSADGPASHAKFASKFPRRGQASGTGPGRDPGMSRAAA
jgi:peroxiredoxin Q/BCP